MKKLYKKTTIGKIQEWAIWVEGTTIFSESGQVGGKKILSSDTIREGKNIGKANETTPEQQAQLEAEARYVKQKKRGYVETIEAAEAGEVDELVEGGYKAMLAKSYDDEKKKVQFPCAVQPKLDGIRCLYDDGVWTRSRKAIKSCPHIADLLVGYPQLDGELYNHDLKADFEKIVSAVRKDEPTEEALNVQYHIYDVPSDLPFSERLKVLNELAETFAGNPFIKVVETRIVHDEAELQAVYNDFLNQGYEGAMVRNLSSPYEGKRTANLLKMKEFQDAEFRVVGINEGRGKLQGSVGAFVCEHNGTTFKAKAEGKLEFLKECFENESLWKGKLLTVRFQGFTGANGLPRFPIGVRFRDEGL